MRKSAIEERDSWVTESAMDFENRARQLDERHQELEKQISELESQRCRWSEEHERAENELAGRNADLQARWGEFGRQESESTQRSADLQNAWDALHADRSAWEAARAQWEDEQRDAQVAIEREHSGHQALIDANQQQAADVAAQRDRLEEQRREFENYCQNRQKELSLREADLEERVRQISDITIGYEEHARQLEDRQREVERQCADLESQRSLWAEECSFAERELAGCTDELQARWAELTSQRAELEKQSADVLERQTENQLAREQLERDRQACEEMHGRAEQQALEHQDLGDVDLQKIQLEASRAELEASRLRLDAELQEFERRRSEAEAEATARKTELEAKQNYVEQQLRENEQRANDLSNQAQRAQELQKELDALRQALLDEQDAQSSKKLPIDPQVAERAQALEQRQGELEAECERLIRENRRLAERLELLGNQSSRSEQLPDQDRPFSADLHQQTADPDTQGESFSAPAPNVWQDLQEEQVGEGEADTLQGSQEEVFARLRSLALLRDEPVAESACEPPYVTQDEPKPERSASDMEDDREAIAASEQQVGEDEEAIATVNAPALPEDEESIDAYMARLLNRVRGLDDKQPQQAAVILPASRPSPQSPTKTVAQVLAPAPEADQHRLLEMSQTETAEQDWGPRTPPPEANELAAMREVANMQARAAIKRYARRRTLGPALGRWLAAAVSLTISIGAVVVSRPGDVLTKGVATAGLAITAYLFYQAAIFSNRFTSASSDRSARQPVKAGKEETATDRPPEKEPPAPVQ